MQLTERVTSAIKMNIKCLAALMVHFNRGQWTIQDWLDPSHKMHCQLTQIPAVRIISEHTGIPETDILEDAQALAPTG